MNTVQVKNTVIGEGRPKICVPIVGKTKTDILEEAKKITTLPVDVVEWRVDWFDDVFATEKVLETAKELQEVLKDIPVLLTFRTSKEGGEKEFSVNDYAALNIAAAQSGYVDLIDVEAFTGDEVVKTIINAAHEAGVKVIASNHDFSDISRVADSSVITSCLQVGITAILGISAPSSCIMQRRRMISSFSGVLKKSWLEAGCYHTAVCHSGNV